MSMVSIIGAKSPVSTVGDDGAVSITTCEIAKLFFFRALTTRGKLSTIDRGSSNLVGSSRDQGGKEEVLGRQIVIFAASADTGIGRAIIDLMLSAFFMLNQLQFFLVWI